MAELPGKALAQELAAASRDDSRATPMEDVIAAACQPGLDEDAIHRLFSRLWVLERMFYYVYGGWGQGLEMNDFPPSVKYLFARQIVDGIRQGEVEVLADGGVRTGLDVVKMVGLGARAVLIGRAWAWAVAARGEVR